MANDGSKRWREETYAPAVARNPERLDRFDTDSGVELAALYGPRDGADDDERVGYPGEFPYTRGIQPTMYRGRLWTMRQYSGYSSAEESNERYRYLLSQGQTGLSVAFDLPTQTGYDSDHEMAVGEVGRVGVPIASLADMEALFDGIPLGDVTTSMTINATAPILLALYLAVARKQGVAFDQLGGTIQNDVLKEYIARGTYIFPTEASLRLITDVAGFCAEQVPRWNTISVSGYHMREAGATAVQELAFTLANGIAYVEAAVRAGLDVNAFGARLSFFFVAQNDLFEEVAKFRAARRMWAHIMRERFGATDPRAWMLRFHTQTAGVALTAQQPEVNTVRTTIQALAAVLGGTQSLHVNARDEALGLPSEESATLALRAQQVLAHESGVADTVDPLAGSYLVEHLTDTLEAEASASMQHIESLGGAAKAIEAGYQQAQIADSAYRHQMAIEAQERLVVGVNAFASADEPPRGASQVDVERTHAQVERLKRVRNERDAASVETALGRLDDAARTPGANTMPPILECVEAYATLGEISDVLREVFGEHRLPASGQSA